MIEGDLLKGENLKGVHLRSYKDRYVILDNLEVRGEPLLYSYSEIYNTDFTYIVAVAHGTLHLVLNNKLLEVKSNDILIVPPFVHFELLESRCIMLCIAVRDDIIQDIYEHCGMGSAVGARCYSIRHYHLERYNIDVLLNDYNLVRIEHERNNYNLKEMTLGAFVTAFLAHLFSFVTAENEIVHSDGAKGWNFYKQFMDLLSLYYKKEREVQFYAGKIGISSKYLSTIVMSYTGHTASVVIDNYIACRIKQMLYSNNTNIKKIGEHYNFPNQSFFGRFFKRVVGVSPYEYQRTHNRKLI